MAALSANDVNTWIPPTPLGVQQEAGFQPQLVATIAGDWAPGNTIGWNSQTYLSFATAGITQTYDIVAPSEDKPKRTRTKVEK